MRKFKYCCMCKTKQTTKNSNTRLDGAGNIVFRSRCNNCAKIYSKEWAIKNPEKQKLRRQRTVRKYRRILKGLKINGCAICGYDKCTRSLDFHHVNPKTKLFNIGVTTVSRRDIIDELNKCVLLCRNCHGEIHTKGVGTLENL